MANKISKRPPSGHRSARRKTAQRDETPIYFGGSSGLQGMQAPALPSLAEYIPLDRMDVHARRQLFGSWLDIVYLNGTDDYEYVRDVPAIEDPALVLQFTKEYEAGAWRKLNRGPFSPRLRRQLKAALAARADAAAEKGRSEN